jgi:hypothetical protein
MPYPQIYVFYAQGPGRRNAPAGSVRGGAPHKHQLEAIFMYDSPKSVAIPPPNEGQKLRHEKHAFFEQL